MADSPGELGGRAAGGAAPGTTADSRLTRELCSAGRSLGNLARRILESAQRPVPFLRVAADRSTQCFCDRPRERIATRVLRPPVCGTGKPAVVEPRQGAGERCAGHRRGRVPAVDLDVPVARLRARRCVRRCPRPDQEPVIYHSPRGAGDPSSMVANRHRWHPSFAGADGGGVAPAPPDVSKPDVETGGRLAQGPGATDGAGCRPPCPDGVAHRHRG